MKLKIPKLFRGSKPKVAVPSVTEDVEPIGQPQPFDPGEIRYCPQRPFPPYRHVPGVTPHPIRDPQGHSYGLEDDDSPVSLPADWRQTEDYLYGVDLYNLPIGGRLMRHGKGFGIKRRTIVGCFYKD